VGCCHTLLGHAAAAETSMTDETPSPDTEPCRRMGSVTESRLTEIEALYRKGFPDFLRVATAILGDRDRAYDAAQDACVRAVRASDQHRGEGRSSPGSGGSS
jgi:hypothetical protein